MTIKVGDTVRKKCGDEFVQTKEKTAKVARVEEYKVYYVGGGRNWVNYDLLEVVSNSSRPDSEHYHTGGIDVWKFAEVNFNYDEVFGFHRIDAIKYLTRFGKKQGRNIRDLEKARAEIDEMIRMEKERGVE